MATLRQPHVPHRRIRRAALAAVVAAIGLTACATGPRPSFESDQPALSPTGDAAVDAVLERLDAVGIAQFTADYDVLTRLGGLNSTATVVQADNSRRSVTVNDIRFLNGTGNAATCNLTTSECEAVINDARVSDVQLSHDFYGASMARRLRVDAARRIGDTSGYEITQGGRPALCVDVPVSGGTKVYCALENGVLARYDGADLFIELTGISDVPDETKFASG
jgi:hypothetical protein